MASSRQRWAGAALMLALALALALAIIGPRRVLAQIQQWLNYVPGAGFVDLEGTQVLAAPVEVSQAGVTLRVTQVVAQSERTLVLYEVTGLPPFEPQPGPTNPVQDFVAKLVLPDGAVLAVTGPSGMRSQVALWGNLGFPPLPADVHRVTLVLSNLPFVHPGTAPESWQVPLTLRPATGELLAELFPQPYAPDAAGDSHHGVTLRVLGAVHRPELTALQLEVLWPVGMLGLHSLNLPDLELRDEQGHLYGLSTSAGVIGIAEVRKVTLPPGAEATPAAGGSEVDEQAFVALSPSAAHLTLTVPEVTFRSMASAVLSIHLPDNPQPGDSWAMDQLVDVDGLQVRFSQARLRQEIDPQSGPALWLEVDSEPVEEIDGRYVSLMSPTLDSAGEFDSAHAKGTDGTRKLTVGVRFRPGRPLPAGPVALRFTEAMVTVRGPWVIAWQVPGRVESDQAPMTLRPVGVEARHDGVALQLESATLTDRITVVEASLADLPAGASAGEITCGLPGDVAAQCTLEDDRGNRYGNQPGVSWQTREPPTGTLIFDAALPLARTMRLSVPAVELAVDGPVSFDVEVPADAATRQLWQAWPVDIPITVGGQALRFVKATLVTVNGQTGLMLTSAPLPVRDRWLAGLGIGAITGPGGQVADPATTFSHAGAGWYERSQDHIAGLTFMISDPVTGAVQPGRYHVELAGARVGVRGPWVLSWELPGR